MSLKNLGAVGVVLAGIGVAGFAGRPVVAQANQKVVAQIIQPDQEDDFFKGTVPLKAQGLVPPTVTKQIDPKYTAAAMRAKIDGDIKLEAVVGIDGRVEKARVKESLHPDLDAEALRTLDQWKFEPGMMNGAPVRVAVEVMMTFRIRR